MVQARGCLTRQLFTTVCGGTLGQARSARQRVGLPRLRFRPLRGEHPRSEMLAMWRAAPANPLVQALLTHLHQAD